MGKYYIKKNIIGFIVGVILCTGTFVYAAVNFPSNEVTYDNTESGLSSTNVKGAIDELYNTCTALPPGEQIIEDNNLEKDPYECRYFFTGANPNNYITFNGENAGWRIISVECDGTIKIMKETSINANNKLIWDSSGSLGSNNWARPSDLNRYLNEEYYNGLNSTAQSQIVSKDWGIGAVTYDNNNLSDQINDENSKKWSGKIALPTLSEFIKTNSNQEQCNTSKLINSNKSVCKNTTWMYNNTYWWTLTPSNDSNAAVFTIYPGVMFPLINTANAYGYSGDGTIVARPSVYLSSDIKITGGDGSQNNPYTLG